MTADREALGEKVRRLRKANGWTAEQLAQRCCCGLSTVYAIENGSRTPGLEMAYELSNALRTSLPELLTGTDWDRRTVRAAS